MKKCKSFVQSSGKCKIKVPYRYNDYCDKDDCPKKTHRSKSPSTGKQAYNRPLTIDFVHCAQRGGLKIEDMG